MRPSPGSTGRRTVGTGATLAGGSQVATAVLGGAMGIVVARILGPADSGSFYVMVSALFLLSTLAMLGLQTGAVYFVSSGRWEAGEAFRQLQLAALGLGVVAGIVGVAAASALSDSAFRGISLGDALIGFAALPFSLSWQFASNVALGEDRYETYAGASMVQNGAALVLAAALAPIAGLTGALAALTGAHLLNAARMTVWGLRRLPSQPGWLRRTPSNLRRSLGFGIQTHVPAVMQYLNLRADLFVLNAVAARTLVGQYAVAVAVTELGLLLPRALTNVVFPRVAALDTSESNAERRMVIEKSVRHAVLLMPVTAGALALALLAVPLVYGADFEPALGFGLVLIPGIALLGAANVLGATLLGKGKPRLVLYSGLVITPPTLLLYALLIPALDGYGAALASSLSYSALAMVSLLLFRRVTKEERIGSLVPGRDELADYRTLVRRIRARPGVRRARSRRA